MIEIFEKYYFHDVFGGVRICDYKFHSKSYIKMMTTRLSADESLAPERAMSRVRPEDECVRVA